MSKLDPITGFIKAEDKLVPADESFINGLISKLRSEGWSLDSRGKGMMGSVHLQIRYKNKINPKEETEFMKIAKRCGDMINSYAKEYEPTWNFGVTPDGYITAGVDIRQKYTKDEAMKLDPITGFVVKDERTVDASVDEIISQIKTKSVPYGSSASFGDYNNGWYAQIQHHGQEEIDIRHNSSKESSMAWGRIWYNKKMVVQFTDPITKLRSEMINYLKGQITKDEAPEHVLDKAIKTTDFSSGDAKKVFEYIDRHVTKDMNDYPKEIERAKTSADCERLENSIRASLDDVVDEYIQIWNEVGLYAQKRKNEVVDKYGKLMSQAFKKYNELKARE